MVSQQLIAAAHAPSCVVEHVLDECYRALGQKLVETLRQKRGRSVNVRLESSVEFDHAHFAQRVEVSAFLT